MTSSVGVSTEGVKEVQRRVNGGMITEKLLQCRLLD